jgi:hypothetical protein
MKKFLITLLCAIVLCSVLLSGCGCDACSGDNTLSFSPLFYGQEGTPQVGYKETAHYKVKNIDTFGSVIKKDASIKDSTVKYNFSGEYTTCLEVLAELPQETTTDLPYGKATITTDQRTALKNQNVKIYKLTTRLNVVAKYTLSGVDKQPIEDFIYTESYFAPAESGFTPIFTVTQSDYSALGIADGKVSVHRQLANNKIVYNTNNYAVTTCYDNNAPTTKTYEYEQSTLIDNAQFLWVMRNINLGTNQQYELSVVSYQYGEFTNLMITNDGSGTANQPITSGALKVNGQDYDQAQLKLKGYSYHLSEAKTRGAAQYVFFQNGENGNLGNRNVMYKYVEPLFMLGSYASLGALEFTLDSFSFEG